MKVVVLGSGTSVPHPTRSGSAYWIETTGGKLLLDCASTAAYRMAEESLKWQELDAIWISHFHLDHCGGLPSFLFGTKYAAETQTRTKPLRIFGPSGISQLLKKFDAANEYGLLTQPFPVEVIEIEPLEKFGILDDVEAVAMKTPHTPESLAIHLTDSGGSTLVFTADTGYDEKLAAFARRVNLLLIECSFVKDKPVEKHLEFVQVIDIIRRAEPQSAILTHLYPEWDNVNFDNLAAEYDTKSVVLQAYDGMRMGSLE